MGFQSFDGSHCAAEGPFAPPDLAERALARPDEESREALDRPSGPPTSIRQILDRIDTLSGLSGDPIKMVSSPSPHPIDTVKARPKMANVNTLLSGEAGLHTTKHGLEIELRLPTLEEGQEYPPLMKFLAACMFRAEEEFGWWEDQARWYDAFTKNKSFTKTRAQIRLVKRMDRLTHNSGHVGRVAGESQSDRGDVSGEGRSLPSPVTFADSPLAQKFMREDARAKHIPEDVYLAACEAFASISASTDDEGDILVLARLIMAEREGCAEIVEAHTVPIFDDSPEHDSDWNADLRSIAKAIRGDA